MIMNLVIWVVLGAIAGWLAGIIMKSGGSMLYNIIVGIIGAFLGGFLANAMGLAGETGGLSIASIITAVVGACVLLFILGLIQKGRAKV